LQSLCNRFAIVLQSLCKRFTFALQSLSNLFAIALQSLCNRLAIALQSLCNRFAIALQSLCDRFTIALQSLCNRLAIGLQSLCNRFATIDLLSIYNRLAYLTSHILLMQFNFYSFITFTFSGSTGTLSASAFFTSTTRTPIALDTPRTALGGIGTTQPKWRMLTRVGR
jgi:hypothetical protein